MQKCVVVFYWLSDTPIRMEYEGCSNMNASSFITFFTYMLRQNVIAFWKELFVVFKLAPNIKKHSLYFSSYRRLYKGHSCILKFFWSKLSYTFWNMCGYSVISLQVWDKMAPNFRCKFNIHWQSNLQKKLYNTVSIMSKPARFWPH